MGGEGGAHFLQDRHDDFFGTLLDDVSLCAFQHLVGEFLFGFGMKLASGCGSRSLIRLGAGNLKSLVDVVFLALSAYMTLRGALALVRVNAFDAV